MRFATDLRRPDAERGARLTPEPPERDDLGLLLEEHLHFAALIRARGRASSLGGPRVSLGRAPNNGVVLRDPSVSKFHAWLEPTDDGSVKIIDPGSTNGTSVNEVPLQTRVPVEARSRDRIRFGHVETVLWSPHALWAAQNPG
ncbi:MAG: FHA domain-containing protein [Polyangiaceae bacterium]